MRLQPASEHPHGLSDARVRRAVHADKPIIFAYHGYPWLIHRLTYRRTNHRNIHVRGYKEEGTITTPFDMAVLNDLDRFHLAGDAVDRMPHLGAQAAVRQARPHGSAPTNTGATSASTAKTCQSSVTGDGRTRRTTWRTLPSSRADPDAGKLGADGGRSSASSRQSARAGDKRRAHKLGPAPAT